MTKRVKVSNRLISYKSPVFVIAEAGVNHNGNLKTAFKLIDVAVDAGVDAVKFQTFNAADVVTSAGKMAVYQRRNTGRPQSQLEMLKKLELPEDFYQPLIKYCKKKRIIFLSTPHGGFTAVDFLEHLKIPAFKFGSGDLTNLPLLQYAAKLGKPMILSTGMASLEEVEAAIKIIRKVGNSQIIVLHCTTNYPCPIDEVNLNAMLTMKEKLNILVGYSDHTDGIQICQMAAILGACVIEKHFTLDRRMHGPDHKASIEPQELKKMVMQVRQISLVLGSKSKRPNPSEISMIKTVRKSIVASREIKAGEIFSEHNLAIKRPGTGLKPVVWFRILGKQAKRDYGLDEQIKKNEI